ncbi:MAG TPA: hypothetical protein EYG85_11955 [Crocinitomix sp.]|nr:hypothetical protein [Crocinitomix sp.]
MTKKILLSTAAAAMLLASNAMAASSTIIMGSDINGTIQDLTIASAPVESNISTTINITPLSTRVTEWTQGVNYIPAIGIGQGNLITIKVDNGYVYKVTGNNLYLVDVNDTADSNASGSLVAAKMTDFTNSSDSKGYSLMTFKFERDVASGRTLALANVSDTNTSLTSDNKLIAGADSTTLAVVANQGLSCPSEVTLSVINSTDQSAQAFPVANANPTAGNYMKVVQTLNINKATNIFTDDINKADTNKCPSYSCAIQLPDETSFGSTTSVVDCPTCEEEKTIVLTCDTGFEVTYRGGTLGTNTALSKIDFTLTTTDTSAITSIKSNIDNGALTYATSTNDVTATLTGNVYSTSVSNGIAATASNRVLSRITVDGTTLIKPRTFDLAVKANGTVDVDAVTNYVKFTEPGRALSVAYMSASANFRSFVRVTSTEAATIQAVIITEDGQQSDRFDTGYSIASKGAVIVEGSELKAKAVAAGFAGFTTNERFNVTLYVKTTGTVDAVAFQTAGTSGSQRYLPVGGATGGGTN